MKKMKRLFSAFLALALVFCLLPFSSFRAADAGSANFCNVVVLTRFAGDTSDVFHLTYTTSWGAQKENWSEMKKMYDTGDNGYDYSMKAFIAAVSDGKVLLDNYFPQEGQTGDAAVYTFEKPQSGYSSSQELVSEVVKAIQNGKIAFDTTHKTDYRSAGTIDNLTLLVQGDSGSYRNSIIYPHHTSYDGYGMIGGKYVWNYNVIDSSSLVSSGAADENYRSKQGVLSHEFLHSLGLADLYHYSGTGDPVGTWDIMSGSSPYQAFPLAYMRSQAGFVTLQSTAQAGSYTVDAAEKVGGRAGVVIKSPLSDSEFFVAEYRKKGDSLKYEFDSKVPEEGLLLYRVNTAYASNANGDDFIYVYRHNPTSPSAGEEASPEWFALQNGETYGSTDLTAAYTAGTLYYSNGSNSGIEISDVQISEDGESVTFTVGMADFGTADLWQNVGDSPVGGDAYGLSIATDGAKLYTAAYTIKGDAAQTLVYQSAESGWTQLGTALPGMQVQCIAAAGSVPVLLVINASARLEALKWDGSAWTSCWTEDNGNFSGISSFGDGDGTSFAYVLDNTTVVMRNALTGQAAAPNLVQDYNTSPSLCWFKNELYILTCNYMATGDEARGTVWKLTNGVWSVAFRFDLAQTKMHSLCADSTHLYALACSDQQYQTAVFDGTAWTADAPVSDRLSDTDLLCSNGNLCISAIRQLDGNSTSAVALIKKESGWAALGADVSTSAANADAVVTGDTLYAAVCDNGGALQIKSHKIPASGSETPVVPPQPDTWGLTLTAPSGYGDPQIYIDGVPFAASSQNGNYSVSLSTKEAKTAVMYSYTGSGVPTGMYVWLLHFSNGTYTAEPQPELENLLSYHGFSIRIAGVSGIRFKTGIDVSTKQQLIAGTLSGFRLSEYGTLVTGNSTLLAGLPMTLGAEKVKSGRAYWVDAGGQVNDRVFETKAGRDRFTSVLTKLPPAQYKTNFAFRGYIVLEKDGVQYTLYGPIVVRNIYYLAQQLISRGEFAAGSAADQFVRKLVEDAA